METEAPPIIPPTTAETAPTQNEEESKPSPSIIEPPPTANAAVPAAQTDEVALPLPAQQFQAPVKEAQKPSPRKPKKRKPKVPRDVTAPRQALTGNVFQNIVMDPIFIKFL